MQTTLSATETKNRFGSVLREVIRTGGPILIERAGQPVAVILSVQAYEEMQQAQLPPAASQLELVRSAFGMWRQRDDINAQWLEQGRSQWHSQWRDE